MDSGTLDSIHEALAHADSVCEVARVTTWPEAIVWVAAFLAIAYVLGKLARG